MDAAQDWLNAYPVATPAPRPAAPAGGAHPTMTPLGPPHVTPAPQQFGWDRNPDGSVTPTRGGPNDPNRFAPTGNASLTGPDYAPTIPDPTLRAMAQGMVDGRIPWPTSGRQGSPRIQQAQAEALQIDPSMDAAASLRRRQAETQFTGTGEGRRVITSAGTLANHLDVLNSISERLAGPNVGVGPINSLLAVGGQMFQPTDRASYDEQLSHVAQEAESLFRPRSGGTEASIQQAISNLGRAESLDERRAAISTLVGLIGGRVGPIVQAYNDAFVPGTTRPAVTWMTTQQRDIYRRLGNIDMPGVAGADMPGDHSGAAAGAAPPGGGSPPPPGASPPNPPQGGSGAPGNQPPPPSGPVPPGGAEFVGQFQDALRSGRFHTPREAMDFAMQLNPALARRINVDDLRRAVANPSQARVGLPHDAAAPAPEQSTWSHLNPGNDPLGFALEGVTHVPFMTGSVDPTAAAGFRGAEDSLSMGFRDELTGASRALASGGNVDAEIAAQRQQDANDWQNHPISRAFGQLAGGAALPIGGEATLGRLALAGGAYGAAHGFGSGEGGMDRLVQAGEQGAGGAILAPVLSVAGQAAGASFRALRGLVSGRSGAVADAGGPAVADTVAALQDEGIPAGRPVADPTVRPRMAYLQSTIGGGGPVNAGLNETRGAIESRVGQLAGDGTVQEPGTMGQIVQGAGDRTIARAKTRAGNLYDRADEAQTAAGSPPILAQNAVQTLDQHIAQLKGNAGQNEPVINYLNTVRGDLVNADGSLTPKTIGQIRDMRTGLNGNINHAGLSATATEHIMGNVLDAAKQDVARDLGATAPDALRLYNRADTLWGGMKDDVRQLWSRIIGPDNNRFSGEQVMSKVNTMMTDRGDMDRFRRTMAALNPSERADFVATAAEPFGRTAPDMPFSPATFIRQTNAISDPARRLLFGADGAQSIANLRLASRAYTDTVGALNNSKSGMVINWNNFLHGFFHASLPALGGYEATGGGMTGLIGATAAAGAQQTIGALARNFSAKALMNPDISAWAARAAGATTEGAIRRAIGALPAIAAKNPSISAEIIPIHRALETTIGRAAAQNEDNRR